MKILLEINSKIYRWRPLIFLRNLLIILIALGLMYKAITTDVFLLIEEV